MWPPALTGSKARGDSWTSSSQVRGQSSRREKRPSYPVAGHGRRNPRLSLNCLRTEGNIFVFRVLSSARLRSSMSVPVDERVTLLNFHLHIAGNCLNECGENLVPTEGWGDRSQNCLHDVRIVGNTELIWDG